jgi:hypothetical protein
MRTLLLTAALTALMLRSLARLHRTHRTRMSAKPAAKPEPLQRWEGEGGNLPVVPQTVNPAIVPADAPNETLNEAATATGKKASAATAA